MYKPNTPKITDEYIKNYQPKPELSTFESHGISALTFIPTDMLVGVCYLAREILQGRDEVQINIISKAIKNMLSQGEQLSFLSFINNKTQESLYFSEGRALYLLHDNFDLESLNILHLSWAEVFSVLALLQCLEVAITINKEYGEDALSQALKRAVPEFELKQYSEISDTIARAEVLATTQDNLKRIGAKGGNAKAQKTLPLKKKVINSYCNHYADHDNKRAGAIIEAELLEENCELLKLSKAQDKAIQFATWIADFKKGKLKHLISINM